MDRNSIHSVRADYDHLAESYAKHLYTELKGKPFDRQVLAGFADAVRGRGEVCDMGCGPGHVTRYLHDAKIEVFGLDLSQRMVEVARTLNPGLRFVEGNMMALPMASGQLAGIAAFYAIVNIPRAALLGVFREMQRVLVSGGLLLLAFHVGEEVVRPEKLWEIPIEMEFFFYQPATMQRLLEEAGFRIEEVLEREPYPPEVEHQSRRAYILARKIDSAA